MARSIARKRAREAEKQVIRDAKHEAKYEHVLAENAELRGRLDAMAALNEKLQHQMEQLLKWRFGRRSERVEDSEQGLLFGEQEAESTDDPEEDADDEIDPPRRRKRRRGGGRLQIPEHLERREEILLPDPAERRCCGQEKQKIGEDVTEILEYEPASLFVRKLIRPVLACSACKSGVAQATMPSRPIEKSIAGSGLLAHVIVSKFVDHLPLHRQESIIARHGVDISRQTMSRWCIEVGTLLDPVADAICAQVFDDNIVNVDDTTILTIDRGHPNGRRRGHIWSWRGLGGEIFYEHTDTRNRAGPIERVGDWTGYVQADACSVYNELFRNPEITEVGCWAHARRRFVEACDSDSVRAAEVLAYIRRLYKIESDLKERSAAASEIKGVREEKSKPILDALHDHLQEKQLSVLPKSPLGKAIAYSLNHWEALTRYLEDGRLGPDNNAAERDLRKVVLGRVNWLFIGHQNATKSATVLMTIVQTCRSLGVEPFAYLYDLLERVSDWPIHEIDQLTPRAWKIAQETAARAAA